MANQIINTCSVDKNQNNNENINQDIIIDNIDNKKGRKADKIRKHFTMQGTRLKCTYNACDRTFSSKTSVTGNVTF
jgi:hypothetical protein